MEETKENDSKNSSKLNTNRSNDQLIDNVTNEELNDVAPIEPIIDNMETPIQEPVVAPESMNIEQAPLPDQNPPIEQISEPIVEPPKGEIKLTANEEFDLLTEEQKQEAINIISNVFISRGKDSFMYLSMQKEFLGEGFEIPYIFKLNTQNFSYSSENYFTYYYKVNHKKFEYQPVFLKHQYQISLWKFDDYGASKVKFQYFTPQHERVKDSAFRGFEIRNSLDNENILIQEKCNYSDDKMLICIMDPYSFNIQSEILVDTVDPDFQLEEGSYDWYDYDFDNLSSQYPTKRNFDRAICWNKGRYLMVYQTKPSKVPAYYFKIYDTTTKEVVSTLKRVNELKLMIFHVRIVPNDPESMYMTLFNYEKACIIKINVFNSTIDIINSHSNFKQKPTDFFINDAADTCYILFGYYDFGRMNNKLYIFGVKESPVIDLYAPKGHKCMIPNYPISTLQNNCFVSIYNNESNFYSASSAGKILFKSIYVENNNQFFNSYNTKDIAMTSGNSVVSICETNNGDYGLIIFPAKENPIFHTIKEITIFDFQYPWINLIKGTVEMITYNVVEKIYYYAKFGAPVYCKSSTAFTAYGNEIRVFWNLGDYIAQGFITFSGGENPSCSIRINKRYMEKKNFPKEEILSIYEVMKVKFPSKEEDAFIIHFPKSIMCYSALTYDLYQTISIEYQKEELLAITYDSFYYWKKGEKTIYALPTPLAFNDRSTRINVYDATDYLKNVKIDSTPNIGTHFCVCDEPKYVKYLQVTNENNKKYLKLINQWFVNPNFTGENMSFQIQGEMLYSKLQGTLLQKKGEEKEDIIMTCEPDIEGLDSSRIKEGFPMASKSWMLFYCNKDPYSNTYPPMVLLPCYNQPKINILDSNETYYYKNEFFFHGDQNYIVYNKQSYSIPYIRFEIYKRNGEIVQILKWEVGKNVYDGSYIKLYISPNGRYMLAFEEIPNEAADPYSSNRDYKGIIKELVLNSVTNQFELVVVKEIVDIKAKYDKITESINNYNYRKTLCPVSPKRPRSFQFC